MHVKYGIIFYKNKAYKTETESVHGHHCNVDKCDQACIAKGIIIIREITL